jgi:ABC-type branched-subunit amino acid transport system substrate-binding protein
MAGTIFINYRRNDSTGAAGRLHDRLAQTFGRNGLFMDVDHVPAGVDFVAYLNSQVAACDVMLVIIGPSWLDAKDEADQRRLDDPDDFVAIEITAALARDNIRVIPVLLDGARMPKASELPDSLKPLARRQAVEVRHTHFGRDTEALIEKIRQALGDSALVAKGREALGDKAAGPGWWRMRRAAVVAALAVLLLIGWGGYAFIQRVVTTLEHSVQQREAEFKAELERQARAAAEAEEKRKADEAERQRLADLKATQERQARAAAEADTRRTQGAAITPSAVLPTGGVIRFGIGGPMTGPAGAFGAQMMKGVEQAVEDINVAGGILGQKITVTYGGDASNLKQGIAVANKFAADGIKFLIGHFNSPITLQLSEVYQENGILQITPASTDPRVTERKMWNIFRVSGRDDRQGIVAGNYITSHFPNGRVAFVHDKTVYGQGSLAEVTRRTINSRGMKEVLFEGIGVGEKNFSALVSKIKISAPQLSIMVACGPKRACWFARCANRR